MEWGALILLELDIRLSYIVQVLNSRFLAGCYYSCYYTSYSSKVTFENRFADDPSIDQANFTVQTWIHLSPKATEVRTEIVVYDFYSLIGDIGGVMGLLLGTSFISLYDIVQEFLRVRLRRFTFPMGGR